MIDIGCRVFRRNSKNIILLWDSNALSETQKDIVSVFLENDDGTERPIKFAPFKPLSSDKFLPGTDGIIINHVVNNIDKNAPLMLNLMFGREEDRVVITKMVNPFKESQRQANIPGNVVKVLGFDYSKNKWVPFPVDVDSFKIDLSTIDKEE